MLFFGLPFPLSCPWVLFALPCSPLVVLAWGRAEACSGSRGGWVIDRWRRRREDSCEASYVPALLVIGVHFLCFICVLVLSVASAVGVSGEH